MTTATKEATETIVQRIERLLETETDEIKREQARSILRSTISHLERRMKQP